MPPIPADVLAKMTPEQRQQFQQSMAATMGNMSKAVVTRSCLTEKTLQRGLDMSRPQENCHRTTSHVTSRLIDATMECTGEHKTTGTFHFEAVSPEQIRGDFSIVSTGGGNTMTIKRTMTGKWLGSDCGTVKPHDDQ